MKKQGILLLSILLLLAFACKAQQNSSQRIKTKDSLVFEKFKEFAKNNSDSNIIELFSFFKDTPYLGGRLDIYENERLVVNLSELDCFSFVENAVSLYLCLKEKDLNIENFQKKLQSIRYRDAKIENYTSRLHYSSDWIYENAKNGVLTDITKDLGGISFKPRLNFMSTHSNKYKALQYDGNIEAIKKIEDNINKRVYYYIPKKDIASIENKLLDGDIIFITTNIQGLDIAHLGFVIKKENKTYLLHASSTMGKVVVSEKTLYDYLADIKQDTGIIVCRLK